MLINLVKNALKFTPSGYIKIYSCYDYTKNSIIIHVEDSGVGVDASDQPLLFSKFGKLQRTAEMNSEGIGLGLTIVKQIVQ